MALAQIEGLGPISLQKLLDYFKSAEACFKASFLDLKNIGFSENAAKEISQQIRLTEPDKLWEQLKKEEIDIITIFDNAYPKLLKEIYAPPPVIYYRGNALLFDSQNSLAVVGSRKISSYAQTVLPDLLDEVIRQNLTIVSGLAYGVDSLAHRLTLENKGQTIAVIGSGLAWDYIYPAGNQNLAQNILKNNGLIVSEFSPFFPAMPCNFPRRNRIISGLAQATLIIEASIKSGALITAKYALEQGREVMAVPGPINSANSQGTNMLIQNGAKPVTSASDILESFGLTVRKEKMFNNFSSNEASTDELIILKILKGSTLHIDKIIEACTLEISLINSLLMQMELKSWVKNVGGQQYISLVTC